MQRNVMIYKSMLLSVLLVPFTMICDDTIRHERIAKLEEKFFQKELQLSQLGEMISQRDKFLSSFSEEVGSLIREIVCRQIEELEKNSGNELSQAETDKITAEARSYADDFLYAFFVACENNENIDGMLVSGLLKQGEASIMNEFESLRFYLIRSTFERSLRVKLVKKYEDCIKEMLVIKAEIEMLNEELTKD